MRIVKPAVENTMGGVRHCRMIRNRIHLRMRPQENESITVALPIIRSRLAGSCYSLVVDGNRFDVLQEEERGGGEEGGQG